MDSTLNEPNPQRHLDDAHRAELRASGLTDATIIASGIYSAQDGDIKDLLGWQPKDFRWGRGMAIPFRFPNSNGAAPYCRVKLDFPRHDKEGAPLKYESPLRVGNRAYFPPRFQQPTAARGLLLITEGEKKALCANQNGFACIGLVGVWGWQQRRERSDTGRAYGQRKLIDDLAAIEWKGRDVVIVFDSDAARNAQVRLAESRLAELLSRHGAKVRVARIPEDGEAKVGLDDFMVAHGAAAFQQIIDGAEEPETPDDLSPMEWAQLFIEDAFTGESGVELCWHRDEFFQYVGTHYIKLAKSELQAVVLTWLDKKRRKTKPRHAAEVVEALASRAHVPFIREAPLWLDNNGPDPRNVIAFKNGLLDISNIGGDLDILEHSPNWFSMMALPFDFDPAAHCPAWLRFLDEVFEGDAERIRLLQQFVGLLLTSDTSYHKLLLMVGPPRSGKGTIIRIIQHVIGEDNCVCPELASLGERFGLWQLVGKTVAALPDAHLSHRADSIRILGIIKSIVGEDSVSIDRKHLSFLTNVRLRVRFILSVNDLPRFSDPSGAFEVRVLLLPFTRSFAEREDLALESTLKTEASGILNWSVSVERTASMRRRVASA